LSVWIGLRGGRGFDFGGFRVGFDDLGMARISFALASTSACGQSRRGPTPSRPMLMNHRTKAPDCESPYSK
jgi:hypothetical protein